MWKCNRITFRCRLRTEQFNTTDEAPKTVSVRPRKRKADVAIHLQDPDEEITEMTRKKPCASQVWMSHDWFVFSTFNFVISHSWASKDDVWNNLLRKDKLYLRDTHVMERHPNLQPNMRAILLDWLMEVCEVYKLHRETFYLGQDYFDRFMATQENVLKTTLQLIGISCLFISAKMEEIYPPKVHQFAYITDGACTEDDILSMEIIIMKELNWSLSPLTPVAWLNIYMQMAYLKETAEVLMAQYPQATFVQIAELLDLCILDVRSLEFSYDLLAASALFHFSSLELVMKVSGLKWCDLEECVRWMVPFAMSIREAGSSALKTFKGIAADDMHNIQTHVPYMEWLGKVHSYQLVDIESIQRSPVPSGVLTPPPSSEKPESTVS
uniref:G1/S-specific cyclin-E1 n=1 Tax=Sinocyclocheilus rhinocerous TaxID=307959 RepID=A0A673GL77_9TELE